MKIDIDEVGASNYSLEEVLVLVQLEYKKSRKVYPGKLATQELLDSCVKRGIIVHTNSEYIIPTATYNDFRVIMGVAPMKLKQTKDFESFWKTFPISDAHNKWGRTRNLKMNQSKTKEYYDRAIKDGWTHDRLIQVLKWDIADRRSRSHTKNHMMFFKNSATWLFQKEYEIIADVMKEQGDEDKDVNWTENTV